MTVFKIFLGGDLDERRTLCLSIRNGHDLLQWLGFPVDNWGALPTSEVTARCRRRLWPMAHNTDPAVEERLERMPNGEERVLQLGREEGYLRKRTEELLQIAVVGNGKGHILFQAVERPNPLIDLNTLHNFLDRVQQE